MTVVGFDLDGTLFSQGKMLEVVNRELGAHLTHDDWKHYRLADDYQVPDERINEIFRQFGEEIYRGNVPQIAVANKLLDHHAKGDKVVLITARTEDTHEATEYALNKYKLPYDLLVSGGTHKEDYLNSLHVDSYYDDYAELLEAISTNGTLDHKVELTLVDAPYNQWCHQFNRLLLN